MANKFDIYDDLFDGPSTATKAKPKSRFDIYDDLFDPPAPKTGSDLAAEVASLGATPPLPPSQTAPQATPAPDFSQSVVQGQPLTDAHTLPLPTAGVRVEPSAGGFDPFDVGDNQLDKFDPTEETAKSILRGGLQAKSTVLAERARFLEAEPVSGSKLGPQRGRYLKGSEFAPDIDTSESDKAISDLKDRAKQAFDQSRDPSIASGENAPPIRGFLTQVIPEMAIYMGSVAIASTVGAAVGGPIVGTAAAWRVGAAHERNLHYQQVKPELLASGMSEEDAERIAMRESNVVGFVSGGIEALAVSDMIKFAKGTAPAATKELLRALRKRTSTKAVALAAGKLAGKKAELVAREATEEVLQELVAQGVGYFGHDGKFNFNAIKEAGVAGGGAAIVLGGGGAVVSTTLEAVSGRLAQDTSPAAPADQIPPISDPKIGEGIPSIETMLDERKQAIEQQNLETVDSAKAEAQAKEKITVHKMPDGTTMEGSVHKGAVEGSETTITRKELQDAQAQESQKAEEAKPAELKSEAEGAEVLTPARKRINARKAKKKKLSEGTKKVRRAVKAQEKPKAKGLSQEQRDINPIGAIVEDNGGIIPFEGKHLKEIYAQVPLRFRSGKGKGGLKADEMLAQVTDKGLLPADASLDDLVTALQGKKKSIQTAARDFDKQQKAREKHEQRNFDKVTHEDLAVGDKFTVSGEKFEVTEETDTALRVKDGVEFFIPFEADETLLIDKKSHKKGKKKRPKKTNTSGDFLKGIDDKPKQKDGIGTGLFGQHVVTEGTGGKQGEFFDTTPVKKVEDIEGQQKFPPPTSPRLKGGKQAFQSDPTTGATGKGKPGFAGVAGRPGGIVAKPWLTQDKVDSPDSEIDDFFGRTRKPPVRRKASKLLDTIKQGLRERFIFASKLPSTKEAALARDMIRTIPEELRSKTDQALSDLQEILDGGGETSALDNAGLDLLRRKVFVQDMLREAKVQGSVPANLTEAQLNAENDRVDALMEQVPSVNRAFEARQKLWNQVSEDLFERGVIDEEAKNNQAYVRHFVLAHAERGPARVVVKKKKLAEPWRAYKKRRTGSSKDISTDYLAVELTALSQIYRDNAIEDMANNIGKEYDKRSEFREEATANVEKEAGGEKFAKGEKAKLIDRELERIVTREGFREWHYKRPNLVYMARTLPESQMAALLENTAEDAGETLNIPKEMVRQALVLGGKRKGMLLPEWLAAQLDDLPVNKRSPYIVASFTQPFVQTWKRWILRVNPFRYNTRNSLGDTERLNASGQTAALAKVPEATKILITKEGDLYQRAMNFGVIGSSLWHEMGDPSRLKQFERFKQIGSQKDFKTVTKAVLGAPLRGIQRVGQFEQDITQLREDILRMAVFMDNLEKLESGKPVRHWAGKVADIEEIAKTSKNRAAAKIARETMVDYGDFTPWENDVLRNGLLPFYSFMKKNATFWPRAFKNAAQEGTAGKTAAAAAGIASTHIGAWLVRVMGLYAFGMMWNYRDDESEKQEKTMPFWLRSMPHLNVADKAIWGQTAMSDFGEWFDHQELAGLNWRREASFVGNKEAAIEAAMIIARAPVNKIVQSVNPFIKGTFTAVSGQEIFPDVFNPRFVASPASKKSLTRAFLGILGSDAKKFYETTKGDRRLEDTLSAYFAGWWVRPIDPEFMMEQVMQTHEWTALKKKSKTTGRRAGQPKKGKESQFFEGKLRFEALKK